MPNWRKLYPFFSNHLAVEGQSLHYVDEGSGETLLFVHGNPTWSFYWHPLIEAFKATHRCVAVDHIGCGLSDKPVDYPYTLSTHVANLHNFVESLDLQEVTLIAHDWGGAIGLGAALKSPDRYSRIVLMNTGAFPPPYIPWRIRACRIPLLGKLAVQGMNAFSRAALTMATEMPANMTADVKAGLLAPYDNWANRTAVYQFVKDIPASPKHPTWQVLKEIEESLPTFADRPVQLVWGMRDWCFRPSCLERFQAIWPHVSTEKIDDAGHFVVLDAPERIAATLTEFFARHPCESIHSPE